MIIAVLIALFLFFIVIPFGFYVLVKVGDALVGIIGLAIIGGLVYWAYTLISGFYIAHEMVIIMVGKILLTMLMLIGGLLCVYYAKLLMLNKKSLTRFIGKHGTHLIKNVNHTATGKYLSLEYSNAKIYNKKTTYRTLSGSLLYMNDENIYVHGNGEYLDQYTVPVDTNDRISCITIFDELWSMRTRKFLMMIKLWKPIGIRDIFTDKTITTPESFRGLSLITTIEANT